jgi:hypothetical protein
MKEVTCDESDEIRVAAQHVESREDGHQVMTWTHDGAVILKDTYFEDERGCVHEVPADVSGVEAK